MKIEYYILDPSKNITALVTTPVKRADKKAIAKEIMKRDKTVEQVGFMTLSEGKALLSMSGDEFCGNALMSAAVLCYTLSGKTVDKTVTVTFSDYGEYKVNIKKKNDYYCCECVIDGVKDLGKISFITNDKTNTFPLVSVKGISHIIADNSLTRRSAAEIIKDVAKEINDAAVGIMIYDREKQSVVPIVYVKSIDTVFVENSCASGTTALSFALQNKREIDFIFPGGIITAKNYNNGIGLKEKIYLTEHRTEDFI